MIQSDKKPATIVSGKNANTLFAIFGTLVDTTWRMFVPVIIGTLIGLWVEASYHIKFAAVYGSIIGLAISILLVALQYRQVTKDSKGDKK